MNFVLAGLLAFLVGSLPWGLWIGRHYGMDIRQYGSGNLGATNVYRALGWRQGLLVLLLDVAKGMLAVHVARALTTGGAMPMVAAMAAVAGHMFTPFAGFRGGKGVATGLGVFLGLAPVAASMAFFVWLATVLLTGWVSLASGMASLVLPVFVLWTRDNLGERYSWVLGLSVFVTTLVILRHQTNWRRIAENREQKIWESHPNTPEVLGPRSKDVE